MTDTILKDINDKPLELSNEEREQEKLKKETEQLYIQARKTIPDAFEADA